jgi:hypothetical protein
MVAAGVMLSVACVASACWLVAETKRSIYFYQVEMHDGTWNRADVLQRLDALSHEALLLDLGEDNCA